MRRVARLDENLSRLFRTPGAAGDLCDLLEGAFCSAQIAAFQSQIGVDHANKRQVREMIAFGDKLRPDDDIDRLFFDHGDKFGGLFGRP